MATVAMGQTDARLDLRMNSEQKETIGRAAAASGMSVSQWALDRLMMSARSRPAGREYGQDVGKGV